MVILNNYDTDQTTITNTTDPELAWYTGSQLPIGYARRVFLTQNATSTIPIGCALFRVNLTTNVPTSGDVFAVEPFITASNVTESFVGFAAQTASGNAMIWAQIAGHGSVQIHGTGATASYSHNQLVAFNSDSGFVVTGAVGAALPYVTQKQTVTIQPGATYSLLITKSETTDTATQLISCTFPNSSVTNLVTVSNPLHPVWARVAATGSVNGASAGTIGSASTDTKTIEAFIMQRNWPYGGF